MNVRVYYNLNRKCYSVQRYVQGKGWRLDHHTDELILKNVTTKVYKSGRDRCIREQVRNVHAYLLGEYFPFDDTQVCDGDTLHYNPYKREYFYWRSDECTEVREVSGLVLTKDGVRQLKNCNRGLPKTP